jgi:hypothetical protein
MFVPNFLSEAPLSISDGDDAAAGRVVLWGEIRVVHTGPTK